LRCCRSRRPPGDAEGARLALGAFEVTLAEQEANILWGRVVPRPLVEAQLARPQTLSQLGQALDVHFLYRGNVTRSSAGYALDLAVIDAATERVLEQRTIKADAGDGGPQLPAQAIRDTTHLLTYFALAQEVARARGKPDAQLDVRDLAFRAKVDWNSDSPDAAAVYATTMKSLKRALELAPDDRLAADGGSQSVRMPEDLGRRKPSDGGNRPRSARQGPHPAAGLSARRNC